MKIVEITPRKKSPIYSGLVKREADIRKNGREATYGKNYGVPWAVAP